jgi:basic membrane protein A
VIWKGPIVGQDGKEVLAAGAVADDKFLGGSTSTSRAWKARSPAATKSKRVAGGRLTLARSGVP